jgi:hypothetical protein
MSFTNGLDYDGVNFPLAPSSSPSAPMIRLIMPKYPLMGIITEADAAEAARDTWDGLHPNMPSTPGACLALLGT